MPDLTLLVAGRLDARTGGSIYNRRMAESLVRRGWHVDVRELDASFPFPTRDALRHAAAVLSRVPTDRLVLVDGMAFGAMPTVVAEQATRVRLVALIHLPLAAEIGLPADVAAHLLESEGTALSFATRVIVTGPATRPLLAEYGLRHHDIVLVEPGTDPAPLATGSRSADVHLLAVAALTPGKGHVRLLEALATLPHRRWHLTCAGSLTRAPETVQTVRALVTRMHRDESVSLKGELDGTELAACYDQSDVVVSASLRETYGMSVAEALARGVPVVATATGAIPSLVGDAGCVVPHDRDALASALSRMIEDEAFRARCAANARRVRERLSDWDEAAGRMAAALGEHQHG